MKTMQKKKQTANADSVGKLERQHSSKPVDHSHDKPLQDKLKQKDWDPIKEMIEITDEYEEGTPKREQGKDYWGACCLESQDVDVVQKPKQKKQVEK